MGEIEGVHDRLADIGIDMARQAAKPGLDRIHALADAGKSARVDRSLDRANLFFRCTCVFVGDGDGRRDIAEGDEIVAELLQRRIGVGRLVVGVGVEQRRLLVEHHFFQDRADRLALGEPLPAIAGEHVGRRNPVERNETGDPAICQAEPVEIVENAWDRHARESEHRHGSQKAAAKRGRKSAGERLVAQDRVEIYRNIRNADAMALVDTQACR